MAEAFIGKNVIENLTIAMYEDLRVIYREYIQNSADSIDKAIAENIIESKDGTIRIDIDKVTAKIQIVDNGAGIPKSDFRRIMSSIASSTKSRDDDKGFRGIGRLGGVSSCRLLRFSCTAYGEDVGSVCEWDAAKTREIISDQNQNPPAAELVDLVTKYSQFSCTREEHYFKVELIDIEPSHEELLDSDSVQEYLVAVAPLPYSVSFTYGNKIEQYAKKHDFIIDEYNIYLNEIQLFKPYKMTLVEKDGVTEYDRIKDVDFRIFYNDQNEVLAWMWYGLSSLEKQIPDSNPERCIRLRKYNIQIGSENTFTNHKYFRESRSETYFIGEVFAVHNGLIPNARRDYFNPNDTYMDFESELKPFFYDKLYSFYRDANKYKSAHKSKVDVEETRRRYEEKEETGSFIDKQEEEDLRTKIDKQEEKANNGNKTIHRFLDREESGEVDPAWSVIRRAIDEKFANKQHSSGTGRKDKLKKKITSAGQGKSQFLPDQLTNLSSQERSLVERIYQIIRSVLPPDQSADLVRVIQKKLESK